MAIIKKLNTRITLKYDSYANWTSAPGKDLVLFKGEVGICEIPSVNKDSHIAPTVIFKVGTGAKYPEGHEKAGEYITFEDLPWASARAADVYSWAKASAVKLIDKKLVFVGGNPDGTDKEIPFNYVTKAEVTAITNSLAAKLEAIESNLTDIDDINIKIGDGFDSTNTVKKAIEVAVSLGQQGVDKATTALTELTKSSGTLTKAVNDIKQLQADLTAEIYARGEQGEDLENRLQSVESFFVTSEGEQLDKALDTLKEIQVYLKGEGEAPEGVISRVAANEAAIKTLQSSNGIIDRRIASAEASIEKNATETSSIQAIVSGYSGSGAIQAAISDVSARTDTALQAAQKAQSDTVTLTEVVNNKSTGLAKTYNLASTAAARVEGFDARITANEAAVSTLQSIVQTGNDSNTKLRTDITSIQSLVNHTSKGNEALHSEITRIAGLVEQSSDSWVTVKNTANSALAKAEAIEADYLKAADSYVLQCGTATSTSSAN